MAIVRVLIDLDRLTIYIQGHGVLQSWSNKLLLLLRRRTLHIILRLILTGRVLRRVPIFELTIIWILVYQVFMFIVIFNIEIGLFSSIFGVLNAILLKLCLFIRAELILWGLLLTRSLCLSHILHGGRLHLLSNTSMTKFRLLIKSFKIT